VKPQARTAARPSNQSALRRAKIHIHDQDIEHQRASERAPQSGQRFPDNKFAAWDFSRIPLYSQGRKDGAERLSRVPAPRLAGPIQRKLEVGALNNPLEHEVDLVADQLMRMPDSEGCPGTAQPQIGCKCDACVQAEQLQKREAGTQAAIGAVHGDKSSIQRRPAGSAPGFVAPRASFESGGRPLSAPLRSYIEPLMGTRFTDVRLHDDAASHLAARALTAQAFTAGQHIHFAADRFQPESRDGMHLLAHELAHTVQQRGLGGSAGSGPASGIDAPNSPMEREADSAANTVVQGRTARVSAGVAPARIARYPDGNRDTEDLLRLTATGELFDEDRLVEWSLNQHQTPQAMGRDIRNSHRFSGSSAVREAAAQALLRALSEVSLDERRAFRDYQRAQQKEADKQQELAHQKQLAAQAKRSRDYNWLAGEGESSQRVLDKPGKMGYSPKTGTWSLSTYDSEGAVVTLRFKDTDGLVGEMRKQLEEIRKTYPGKLHELAARLRADREVVKQTMDDAWLIQKPGLWFAGLGFSNVSIMYGVQGVKRYMLASHDATKALARIEKGTTKVTEAEVVAVGQSLNDARYLTLEGGHLINQMLREKDLQDQSGLERLQNVSKAGDIAANFLAPGIGFGLSTGKNFAVRAATVHSTGASFGVGEFVKETAVGLGTMELGGGLAGKNPGFVRNVASNLGSG
jgi:hypothetical protein